MDTEGSTGLRRRHGADYGRAGGCDLLHADPRNSVEDSHRHHRMRRFCPGDQLWRIVGGCKRYEPVLDVFYLGPGGFLLRRHYDFLCHADRCHQGLWPGRRRLAALPGRRLLVGGRVAERGIYDDKVTTFDLQGVCLPHDADDAAKASVGL